jgi:hypothetical protein
MPTLQQQIAEKFLARLAEAKALNTPALERLRFLLADRKKVKADDLAKVFTFPMDGEVK